MPTLDLSWPALAAGALLIYWGFGLLYWLFVAADMRWRPRTRDPFIWLADVMVLACLAFVWPFEAWDNWQGRRR